MGCNQVTAARLSICAFCFSLMQLSLVLTFGFEVQSTVCLDDHFAYLNSPGHEMFYINLCKVDRESFCKALQFHSANHCPIKNYFGNNVCALDLSTVKLSSGAGRKLLLNRVKESAISPQMSPHEGKNYHQFTYNSKIVGMAVPGMFIFSCLFLCPCLYSRRKENDESALQKEPSMNSASPFDTENILATPVQRVPPSPRYFTPQDLSRQGSINLNYSDIVKATQNFSTSLIIGEGGFGTVYKAQLQDGRKVAIKRSRKAYFDLAEFESEVAILSRIDHQNLVKMLGYVDRGLDRIIITEYVPNGTLRQHLDGERVGILNFNQRLGIAIDIAHGLTYLHQYAEKQIIHRDVKSSNIFLTDTMRAKVADFGFARAGLADDHSYISTQVKGTIGYVDPEYMRTSRLTLKSDVYSFGIVLLEILTGRRPVEPKRAVEERLLLRWATINYHQGNFVGLVDPQMDQAIDAKILKKMFWLAIQCAAPVRADRPSMRDVGERLWEIRMDSQKPSQRA
ncbi:hypothetical protein Nepgr_006405 [Nepenthes gracilis]|uniref:non-specific serine/threonine protein kinase n=1 Tax=Nepenthes gracilis TaxID=150966 RepID=A0AAD3S5F8_NEPGR|nr:hypothetical protein Nepgr_006405 [Nepenthes gracilis]